MRIAYLSNRPTETEWAPDIDYISWSDPSAPSLIGYDLLLLEAPSSTDGSRIPMAEIDLAGACGSHVVWLAGPESDLSSLAAVFHTEISPLRAAAPVQSIRSADPALDEYFRIATESWAVFPGTLAPGNTPLAFAGQSEVPVALQTKGGTSRRALLPLARNREAGAAAARQWARSRLHAPARRASALTRARLGCLAFAFLVVVVVLARFSQRDTNVQYARVPAPHVPYDATVDDESALQDSLTYYLTQNWLAQDDIPGMVSADAATIAAGEHLQDTLRLFAKLSLIEKERDLIAYLTRQDEHGALAEYLVLTLIPALQHDLALGRLSSALTRSYMVVELYCQPSILARAVEVPSDSQTDLGWEANRAQRVIELLESSYPYADDEATAALVDFVRDRSNTCDSPQAPDPSISDLLAYCYTAGAAAQVPWEQTLEEWRAFLRSYPRSVRADEAQFNAVRALHYLALDHPGDVTRRKALTEAVTAFAASQPTSYLVDDAVVYAMNIAARDGSPAEFEQLWRLMRDQVQAGDDHRTGLLLLTESALGLQPDDQADEGRLVAHSVARKLLMARAPERVGQWASGLSNQERTIWQRVVLPAIAGHLDLDAGTLLNGDVSAVTADLVRRSVPKRGL